VTQVSNVFFLNFFIQKKINYPRQITSYRFAFYQKKQLNQLKKNWFKPTGFGSVILEQKPVFLVWLGFFCLGSVQFFKNSNRFNQFFSRFGFFNYCFSIISIYSVFLRIPNLDILKEIVTVFVPRALEWKKPKPINNEENYSQ
jgi:hypothetical protein